ncbi:MAG: exodeoxyribonuclease VII large subunit [Gammaproteobacteria bacterium]
MENPNAYPFSEQKIYTVSQLNRASKLLLNDYFPSVQVAGEISNLSRPSSGHLYFTLKDESAQIRCAFFKGRHGGLGFKPENGHQVIARAQVTLYEPRGDYQLVVDALMPAGDGALRQAFDALKRQLAEQGLFDPSHKKKIPTLPSCIGIISSPTGAALRDILSVLKRRFPFVPVIVYPVAVQGEQAKYEIAGALTLANELKQCDILILARGGGSLEDLWSFNEEIVARAVYASAIPVITGIGHEIDFSIADFVADLRAPTPSAAAEHAVPDQREWLQRFQDLENTLRQYLGRICERKSQTLNWLNKRLEQQHPGQKLVRNAQRLDDMELRLIHGMRNRLRHDNVLFSSRSGQLRQLSPSVKIDRLVLQQQQLQRRLTVAYRTKLQRLGGRLALAGQTLHTVSPLATLSRGYALVTDPETGKIIRSTQELKSGDAVLTLLAHGRFTGIVETLNDDE